MTRSNLGEARESSRATALRVVVLASGNGTNFQAILDAHGNSQEVEIAGIATNKPSAPAIARAQHAGVPFEVFERQRYGDRTTRDIEMANWIEKRGADLVVAAGYMEILSPDFVDRFQARIINIHPSLLPEFRGLNAIERAFEAKVEKSGVTVHFVDEGVDTGPVIVQREVKRRWWQSRGKFEARIHAVEHELLPMVIGKAASGELKLGPDRNPAPVLTAPSSSGSTRYSARPRWRSSASRIA